jgi:para-nitrobenzyl esterase
MSQIVETACGRVAGAEVGGILRFLGIPYAAPPLGSLRFRPPAPCCPWAGIRDASAYGPIALQPPPPLALLGAGSGLAQDESCLTLNVFTPRADAAHRPVLVWIHGGGFTMGSGAEPGYDGAPLARRGDVVVVTFNYRLGALGLATHPDFAGRGEASGNWALLDQIAALRFVRENAARFGGDPENVTIFGESAGGVSVGLLLAAPEARGLFRRAIVQSGAPLPLPRAQALEATGALLEALGLDARDAARLREIEATRLLAAQTRWAEVSARGRLAVRPCVDGVVLPRPAIDAVAGGAADDVPLLVGTTRDEYKLFASLDPGLRGLDDAGLRARLARLLPGGDAAAGVAIDVYRSARLARGEKADAREVWCALMTDRMVRAPLLRLAEAHAARGNPVFVYRFDWESPAEGGALGACHGLELAFVFGTLAPGTPAASFTGAGPDAELLSERMMDAWLAFARAGDPSTPALGVWPRWGAPERETLLFDRECRLARAPQEAERACADSLGD